MRPFRFVIHLREFGWAPTVLTIGTPGQQLTEKEARLLGGVDIVELEPPFDRSVTAESQLGLAARQKAEQAGRLGRAGKELLDLLDRQFPVDTWLLLFLFKYRAITETVRRVRPHVLWSTGDPWSGLVVAQHLARRFDLPWVADFRDPWTLCDVRSEGLWPPTKAANRYLERRVLETADTVLFQARQTERVYRQHYAALNLETTTIYNSYDPAVFEDPVDLEGASARAVAPGEGLSIGFFGRFRSMSPAALMVDVLAAARRRHGPTAERIKVHSFGPLSEEDARYAEARGVLKNFHREEAVPLEKALAALRRFDLLLVSTDPRRDEIVPAKLLEYLAAARPVLSLSRNPEVGRILERTGTGVQLRDPEKVAGLLVDSLRAKEEGRPLPVPFAPEPDEIRRFEARATTRELAALFAATVEQASARPHSAAA